MHPLLLRSPPIPSYGALLLLGLIAAWWLARRRARGVGLDASHVDLLAPLLVAAGLIGSLIAAQLAGAEGPTGGGHGRALYGGLIGGVAVGLGYALVARLPLGKLGDVFAVPLAVGIALGRVGCFLAGCCFGDICAAPGLLAELGDPARRRVQTLPGISGEDFALAVRFPAESPAYQQQLELGLISPEAATALPVHPVQLYEAAAVLTLGIVVGLTYRLGQGKRRNTWRGMWRGGVWGEAFLAVAIGYGVIRFLTELLRADNPTLGAGSVVDTVAGPGVGLTAAQWVAAVVVPVCVVLLAVRRRLADRLGLRSERGANAG